MDVVRKTLVPSHFWSRANEKSRLATEGPSAFYKGTVAPLIGIGACVSLQFAFLNGMFSVLPADVTLISSQRYNARCAKASRMSFLRVNCIYLEREVVWATVYWLAP